MKKLVQYFVPFAVVIISIALFVIPFFWLKPGEVDLGGDCSRLYFLDPIAFLKNYSLFGLSPSGITSIDPNYYYIPHLVLLQFFRIFWSPTTVIAITQGMKLSFSFIVMFLFIKEIIFLFVREKSFLLSFTSFIGALVYVSFITVFGWERSLISHNQVFINPFVAFMVLKYITTRNFPYLGIGIIGSLLFAPSFGFTSTPQIFSFFPLVGIFLLGYIRWIVLKPIPWKEIGISLALFACVHAFHLIPTAAPLFDIANSTRFQIFNAASKENPAPPLTYFEVNRPQLGKISTNIFQPSAYHTQEFVIFFVPVLILIAFIFVRNRLMALTGIFFVLTLFLVSANITQVGVSLYRSFFYLPGFAMFRSFNEKWYFVYVFFYTVLFAVSFYQLFLHKRKIGMLCVGLCIFGSIIYRTVPFLQGNAVHTINYQSKNVSTNFVIDPDLMETFAYVRTLPQDGKVITLPLTFPSYQIVFGKSEGAYVGL